MTTYEYFIKMMNEGKTTDDIVKDLAQAEADFKAEAERKAKEEQEAKVREEILTRAKKDIFDAYKKYWDIAFNGEKLPADAEKLFNAELNFINYMMNKNEVKDPSISKLYDTLFDYLFS